MSVPRVRSCQVVARFRPLRTMITSLAMCQCPSSTCVFISFLTLTSTWGSILITRYKHVRNKWPCACVFYCMCVCVCAFCAYFIRSRTHTTRRHTGPLAPFSHKRLVAPTTSRTCVNFAFCWWWLFYGWLVRRISFSSRTVTQSPLTCIER